MWDINVTNYGGRYVKGSTQHNDNEYMFRAEFNNYSDLRRCIDDNSHITKFVYRTINGKITLFFSLRQNEFEKIL